MLLIRFKTQIRHHAGIVARHVRFDVTCGLTKSLSDYFFKTNLVPQNGKNIVIGFEFDAGFQKIL